MRYIEKVALAWADKGIQTVKQAKAASSGYNDTAFSVLGAFGITNRQPAKSNRITSKNGLMYTALIPI